MNEAETRTEHIDPALKAAGWGVVEGSRIRREYSITPGRIEGLGRRSKPLTADYVQEYRNRKLAAALDGLLAIFSAARHAGRLDRMSGTCGKTARAVGWAQPVESPLPLRPHTSHAAPGRGRLLVMRPLWARLAAGSPSSLRAGRSQRAVAPSGGRACGEPKRRSGEWGRACRKV